MATHGNRRTPVLAAVASGIAELRPDRARPQGWTLLVDGVPQSYVDLADPEHLEFPYVRQIARAVRAQAYRKGSCIWVGARSACRACWPGGGRASRRRWWSTTRS